MHSVSLLSYHGPPVFFLPCHTCLFSLCGYGTQNNKQRQNQKLQFKFTTRTMRATLYREHPPAHWLSTPSQSAKLGQQIRTPYAPKAWRNFHSGCFISRVCQRGDEDPRRYFCNKAISPCCRHRELQLHKHCLCKIW